MEKRILFLMVLFVVFLNPASAIDFSVSPEDTSFTLRWGETIESSVEITSQNSWYAMSCDVHKDGQTVETVNDIGSGQTKSGSYSITAPESNSGTMSIDFEIYCEDDYGANDTQGYSVYVTYPVDGQQEAHSLIESTDERINSASSRIAKAENKVSEAEGMDASVMDAQRSISSANSGLENANTYFSRANNAYDNNNFRSAQDYARTAQNRADSALSHASDAIRKAETAIQERKSKAQGEINDAETEIESLKSDVGELESKIETARSNGLNMRDEEQKLENYRSSLSEAESSLDEAKMSFDDDNYGEALNKAQEALRKASSALNNVRSTVDTVGSSIPDSGESTVPSGVSTKVKGLLRDDQEVSRETADLTANNFERKDIAITKSAGTSYSVEMIYSHPSGETVTLSSIVNTAENRVSGVSLPGNPSKINQNWEESQATQETRNSILLLAGVAIIITISGAFAYYFVNPVNRTVNNFVGDGESESSSSGSEFSCPSCGAPVTPDILEDGECPYCGSTVSPS